MKTSWNDRNAFVTGATGFIGAHVAKMLVERGAGVVCLQRDSVRSNTLDLFDLRRHVTVISGSVEDYALMQRILNEYGIDSVFHLAAQAIVGPANRSPFSTLETNIRGTYALLEACRISPTVERIVVASSDKAYGTHKELPYTEDYPLQGIFPYDASKACEDILARSFAHTFNTPLAVTRFANIYGPGDLNLSRIVPGTIISALRGVAPIVRSDGTPVRDFVHVEDAARGYLLLADRIGEVSGEAFNFGSGEPIQILDLVKRIIAISGRNFEPHVLLQRKIEGEIDAQYLSSVKAEQRLGWRAEISLDEGLRQTIRWYHEHLDQMSPPPLSSHR